jgi:uncharacterized protein (DUF433 family)
MATSSERVERELAVSRDPEIRSGELVFTGTRVPVATLVDYLKHGRSVEDFLTGFPSVERWQVEAYLDLSSDAVEAMSGRRADSP